MLAYHPYWLEASRITRTAKRWLEFEAITPMQYKILAAAFTTPLYSTNMFERVALFVFTSVCVAGTLLFTAELWDYSIVGANPLLLIAIGVLCIAILELFIKFKTVYRTGIDDALLYAGLSMLIGGIFFSLDKSFPTVSSLLTGIIALSLLTFSAIRYVDRICSAAAFICALYIITGILRHESDAVKELLPFALLTASSVAHFGFNRMRRRKRFAPWVDCIDALTVASLCTFALAGNFYVIQHYVSPSLSLHVLLTETVNIAPFCYAFTFLVPVAYVVWGLVTRNRLLLRMGLVVEAFSLWTFRSYFHAIAIEHALIILGVSLLLLASAATHLLKTTKITVIKKHVIAELPEHVSVEDLTLPNRSMAQSEAVKAFEAGDGHFRGDASLGW